MEMHLYTVHQKNRRDGTGRLRMVLDRFSWFALLLWPLWLLWNGLWVMAGLAFVLLMLVGVVAPDAALPVFSGLAFLFALEGAVFTRAELRLRGWREVGVVEARSAEGAEELFLTGRVA